MEKEKISLKYDSPSVEIVEVKVEHGFAATGNPASGENYDPINGSWDND